MKEDFLHYVWQFKKFDVLNLKTEQGEKLSILNSGQYLKLAGPDFFNAQITIDNQHWAGNVEIHLKSSDWYLHGHEQDTAYDAIILHVVWEHDSPVFRQDNTEVPVLELKNYVSHQVLKNYNSLSSNKSWIFCETELATLDTFIIKNWQERLFFERLERKAQPIIALAKATQNDWEAILFCLLAKNFGLNTNGESFFNIANSIPFSIIKKESFEVENMEALLFGRAGLLKEDKEDLYSKDLKNRYNYLCHKYQLPEVYVNQVQFFKHRPDNFPTIRLSQLAKLYAKHQNIFSKIMECKTVENIYNLFDVETSNYWQTHYQFDKLSPKKRKKLTRSFIDLIIINTIVPLKFVYSKAVDTYNAEILIDLLNEIAPEKNTIIEKFGYFKIKAKSAYETQALLQLKNEYCNYKKCMECALGLEILKN